MKSVVSYRKDMITRAKTEKKWMVTVSVNGKHLGDDSCSVQALVDLRMARRLTKLALFLLRGRLTKDR